MNMKILRAVTWVLCMLMMVSGLPAAQGVQTSAQCSIVMDADSGRVLYEKNADTRSLIASTTKIMTALVVCEQCNVLDRVEIMPEAVGIEGSSMYLQAGEVLTVQELLYGLMLHSGNDAAVALAIYCGGTVEGFVQLMNDEARRLGLKDTHFENPNGLDDEHHYSTARDLARLTAVAMENPVFAKTVSTKSVRVGERYLTNHNKLLWRYVGADGVKTGYTKAAGRILVSTAKRDGRRLIVVTINDPDDWQDHSRLLDVGFDQYTPSTLVSAGECVGSVAVASGTVDQVRLLAAEEFVYPIAQGETVTVAISGPGFVFAPVERLEKAGYAHVLIDGVPVGRVPLVWADSVEQQEIPEKRRFFGR